MKKIGLMMLALVLVFSLAACGNNNNEKENAANTENTGNTGGNAGNGEDAAPVEEDLTPEAGAKLLVWDSGENKDFIEKTGKEFKEKYGVDVTFAEVGADKSMAQMITDGPAGVGADVFTAVHDRTGSGVQAGVILPNDFYEEQTKAESYDTAIQAVTVEGVLYGYPRSVETTAVFYNKDLIAEVPADWNGVIEFAKTFNKPAENQFAYMWEAGNGYWSYGFFGGYGAYVFGQEGTDATDIGLNNEGAVEAGKFFASLKEILPLKTSDINGDIKKSLFEQKKLAMNVSGPWDTGSLKQTVPNLGVAPYPNLPNGQPMKPFSGVKSLFINASTKYPNASKLFARYLTSAEKQLEAYKTVGVLPANKVAAEDPTIKDDPIASGFLKQFENSVPMPSIPEMAQYWAPMEAALAAMWNDGTDAKKALDNMVSQMKSNIQTGQ